MANQLYFEDVKEGGEVTPLKKIATTQMLVRWGVNVGDYNPLHYDIVFAQASGVGKPIVHGSLKRGWLIQMMTDWAGENGFLKKFSCSYRAMDWPRNMKTTAEPLDGETWTCKGKITKKYVEGNEHLVDCDIWLENGKGEQTTTGKATAILPAKS